MIGKKRNDKREKERYWKGVEIRIRRKRRLKRKEIRDKRETGWKVIFESSGHNNYRERVIGKKRKERRKNRKDWEHDLEKGLGTWFRRKKMIGKERTKN